MNLKIYIMCPFQIISKTKQSTSSKANVFFPLKFSSSLLSAEGELLLDKTRPDVLGDGKVWFPGKKK